MRGCAVHVSPRDLNQANPSPAEQLRAELVEAQLNLSTFVSVAFAALLIFD